MERNPLTRPLLKNKHTAVNHVYSTGEYLKPMFWTFIVALMHNEHRSVIGSSNADTPGLSFSDIVIRYVLAVV